jgi:hypothetical protein
MSTRGHNETPFRLDALAADARRGLERVAAGEDETLAGWLAYGAALNEGRALFPGDREFGEWCRSANLAEGIHDHDRAAAMWAAGNREQFEEARAAGKARTIRGIHAKWKEIEAEREKAEAEARRKAEADAKAAEADDDDDDEIGATPDAVPEATTAPDPVRKPSDTSGADKAGTSVADAADGPAPTPDPWRKGLTGLTREGLEDEVAGLREMVADLKATVAKLTDENQRLTEANAELAETNQGAVISALQRQLGAAKYARDEAMRAAKRMEYRMKKAQKDAEIVL